MLGMLWTMFKLESVVGSVPMEVKLVIYFYSLVTYMYHQTNSVCCIIYYFVLHCVFV